LLSPSLLKINAAPSHSPSPTPYSTVSACRKTILGGKTLITILYVYSGIRIRSCASLVLVLDSYIIQPSVSISHSHSHSIFACNHRTNPSQPSPAKPSHTSPNIVIVLLYETTMWALYYYSPDKVGCLSVCLSVIHSQRHLMFKTLPRLARRPRLYEHHLRASTQLATCSVLRCH
jgi:hypothetical protein